MNEWVEAWASLSAVANSVPCYSHEADRRLRQALAEGKIRARTGDGCEIARDAWDAEPGAGINFREKGVEVRRDDLFRWLAQEAPDTATNGGTTKGAPGRKVEHDWETFWCALCVIVHEEGFTPGRGQQAELTRRMRQWYERQGTKCPSDTEMKGRIGRFLAQLSRQ